MGYEFSQDDVFNFADALHFKYQQKGNELFFTFCPYCNGNGKDKNTCSVNLDTGAFKCFRSSCGKQGHFVEMARDFDFELFDYEKKEYKKLPQRQIKSKPKAIEYLQSRGIGEKITAKYHITTRKDNDNVLVFPFYDEQNELVFIKYRQINKKIKGSKEWCEKDTKPILFGMVQCVDFDTLVITEGQIDSLSVAECGIKNAVSVPTGANGFTWFANCYEWINKFKEVVVFGDNEHGKITLVEDLQKRLNCKVRAVRKKDYLGEKDANAILNKYGKQAIITAVENAEVPKMNNVKDLSTVQAVDVNALPKFKTNIKELDRAIGGIIFGQVVLLTGKRGNGKSTFMSQIVCEALEQNESVFIYSGELADYHFKRWLDYQLAGPDNIMSSKNEYGDDVYSLSNETISSINSWYKGRAFIYDNSYIVGDDEIETLPNTIEKAIKQYNIKLVCIDNLMTAMECVNDTNNLYLAQSNFVGALKKIAVKYDVAIILVAHPRKSKDGFTNDDVSGSSDITNKVDLVLNYYRDDKDEQFDGKLEVTKNRLFGKYLKGNNAIGLYYSQSTKRITSPSSLCRRYSWSKGDKTDTAFIDAFERDLPW